MGFEDRNLVCAECGIEFLFTAGEQEFYVRKGFEHDPKRCRDCRTANRGRGGSKPKGPGRGAHMEYFGATPAVTKKRPVRSASAPAEGVEATCSSCGAATRLPFRPDGVRPVYCRACYQERRRSSGGN